MYICACVLRISLKINFITIITIASVLYVSMLYKLLTP